MITPEQKYKWRQILIGIIVTIFVALFTFMLAKIDSKIEKRMQDFKLSQTTLIELQMEMIDQQKYTQALLSIEFSSTDYALLIMFDGEYQKIKTEKKAELIKDYEFKNKSKGD